MKQNYPIHMKISFAHFQMMSNRCTKFQKNPCTHSVEHAWPKSCPQMRDRQTDKWIDRQVEPMYPQNFVCRVYKNY